MNHTANILISIYRLKFRYRIATRELPHPRASPLSERAGHRGSDALIKRTIETKILHYCSLIYTLGGSK